MSVGSREQDENQAFFLALLDREAHMALCGLDF